LLWQRILIQSSKRRKTGLVRPKTGIKHLQLLINHHFRQNTRLFFFFGQNAENRSAEESGCVEKLQLQSKELEQQE